MMDEDVIRRRLLIDGDGVGDDRRINVLLKSFIKWTNAPEVDIVLHERMLSQLAQCEFAQKKSKLISSMNEEELKNYDKLAEMTEEEIGQAKLVIDKTKEELVVARKKRKNKMEYDILAKVISKHPVREKTNLKILSLQKNLTELKKKLEKHSHALSQRKKQFHVLLTSINMLQDMLDNPDNNKDAMEVDKSK